jgi:hypothetical protein
MNKHVFTKKVIGKKIYFQEDKLPYKIMALSDRYIICVRKLNRIQDKKLLEYMVDMGGYPNFKNAYKDNKDCPVYTIVDLQENVRASDDLIFPMLNYFEKSECDKAIDLLNTKQISLSKRNKIMLMIDWEKTKI